MNNESWPGTGDLLRVRDVYGRYARAYGLASQTSCEFTDEGVYFAKRERREASPLIETLALMKLPYDNTPETQDGVEIAAVSVNEIYSSILQVIMSDGHMVYSVLDKSLSEPVLSVYSINYEDPDNTILLASYSPVYHYADKAFEWFRDGYLYYFVLTGHQEFPDIEDRGDYRVKIDGSEEPERLN